MWPFTTATPNDDTPAKPTFHTIRLVSYEFQAPGRPLHYEIAVEMYTPRLSGLMPEGWYTEKTFISTDLDEARQQAEAYADTLRDKYHRVYTKGVRQVLATYEP